jgi:signal transduction histidine kinase
MRLSILIRGLRSGVLPVIIVGFVAVLGAYFYLRAETLMSEQLRERLQSTASVAAGQFDADDVLAVRGIDDRGSPAHRRLVEHLQRIRAMTPGARYAYIVRATDDPDVVEFVADADEFRPAEDVDLDGDGTVDDEEAPAEPGEKYDVAGMEAFREGFDRPSVDADVTYDRWGALISGYAPVRDARGRAVAVLGIDMEADEFLDTARSIFSPVAFLFVLLAGAMLASFAFSVSQRRRLESLKQLEAERTALLDLATHQLGMPLATFRWWLEILRERKTAETTEDREAYDQLQLGVDRMDHIIRSLQEAARLQSDDLSYHAESVDPASFVEDIVASMRSAFELKKQRVDVVRGSDVPPAMIDRKLMAGVLGELLENARGYSPAGSDITVRVSRVRAMARIEVVDHGCGIPADQIPRMFQKFTRGKNAYANKPVGNGLGLYICKGIVERGGGTLSVSSAEGKGTTMTLDLPLAA